MGTTHLDEFGVNVRRFSGGRQRGPMVQLTVLHGDFVQLRPSEAEAIGVALLAAAHGMTNFEAREHWRVGFGPEAPSPA